MTQSLIERLEKLTGPDREVDRDIELSFGKFCAPTWEKHPQHKHLLRHVESDDWVAAPRHTESIDAALTLVPEGSDVHLHIYKRVVAGVFIGRDSFEYEKDGTPPGNHGQGPTAIAICIAALRARTALEDKERG